MAEIPLTDAEYRAGLAHLVRCHAESYAKVLVLEDPQSLRVQVVDFLLSEAGYSTGGFLLAWVEGDFDA